MRRLLLGERRGRRRVMLDVGRRGYRCWLGAGLRLRGSLRRLPRVFVGVLWFGDVFVGHGQLLKLM